MEKQKVKLLKLIYHAPHVAATMPCLNIQTDTRSVSVAKLGKQEMGACLL